MPKIFDLELLNSYPGKLVNPQRREPAMLPGILLPSVEFLPSTPIPLYIPTQKLIAANLGMEAEDFYTGMCWAFDVDKWEGLDELETRAIYSFRKVLYVPVLSLTGFKNPVNERTFLAA